MSDADLERILQFEAGDLPYNRRGERSPRQLAQMKADSRGCLTRLLLANGLAVAFMVGTRLISAQAFDQIGVFALPVLFLAGPWLIISLFPTPKSVYIIQSVEGDAKLTMGYTSGSNKYHMLVVDGVDFRIPQALHDAINEGDAVAVYYTSAGTTKHIVSMERL